MLDPGPTQAAPHAWVMWHAAVSWIAGGVTGVSVSKWVGRVVNAMPPLPPNESWMKQWAYAALHACFETKANGTGENGGK